MPDPMTLASLGALSNGVNVLEKTGLLQTIKSKLISNPDAAAAKLAGVLNEVAKTYEVIDDVIVQFAAMSLEDEDARQTAKILLMKINGGQLMRQMMDARAHCSTIGAIYKRYLTGWFNASQLSVEEQAECESLFRELADADMQWIEMLSSVAQGFETLSDQMLENIAEDDFEEADSLRRNVLKSVLGEQKKLSTNLIQLQQLKIDFFNVSSALH